MQAWRSRNKAGQAKNRRRFHAFRRRAHAIVNTLVRQALAAAPAEPLRVARRFPLHLRYEVYRTVAASPRLQQLAETFPALLARIVGMVPDQAAEATRLVERGAKLSTIAELVEVPLALRKCRPGVVHLALLLDNKTRNDTDIDLSRLIGTYLPTTTSRASGAGLGPSMVRCVSVARIASGLPVMRSNSALHAPRSTRACPI